MISKKLQENILTADKMCREYRANRSREAAYFLLRLCASCDTLRQIYLACSITRPDNAGYFHAVLSKGTVPNRKYSTQWFDKR